MNYLVGVCGHFAHDIQMFDGQTVKTKMLFEYLNNEYPNSVKCLDTHNVKNHLLLFIRRIIDLIVNCRNIIILPAENGLQVIAPLVVLLNVIFKRNLHYVVIGGWLPVFLKQKRWLIKVLKKIDYIYVETIGMKELLQTIGLTNVFVLPNFKELTIVNSDDLYKNSTVPLPVCTFSRVMREKGIEDAVNAIVNINTNKNSVIYTLDIYGNIDELQAEWFELLKSKFPSYINYKGVVPSNESTSILKNYYALLFPTFYEGEGFAGTLIDAMASGLPVIASDWKYNSEIISNNFTGLLIDRQHNLEDRLIWAYQNPNEWNKMRVNCLNIAKNYLPENALNVLVDRL